jgi:RNA polymerase sigma factor (sigma-70 family)
MPPQNSENSCWFAENIQPHDSMLRAWLRRRFPDVGEVDDIVQETYLRALEVHDHGKLFAPKAFLFTTARHLALDEARRARHRQHEPLASSAAPDVIDDTADVPDLVARRQEITFLHHAIASLPAQCRQIFILRRIHGRSQQDIARLLGLSPNTVSAQLTIGLRKCSDYLEDYRKEASA